MARLRPRCFSAPRARARRLGADREPLIRRWCGTGAGRRGSGIRTSPMCRKTFLPRSPRGSGASMPTGPGRRFGRGCAGVARHELPGAHPASWRARHWRVFGPRKRIEQVAAPPDDVELSERPDDLASLCQRALGLVRHEFEDRTWPRLARDRRGAFHRRRRGGDGHHLKRNPPGQVPCPQAAEGRDRGADGLRLTARELVVGELIA